MSTETKTKTAELVRKLKGYRGDARLYRVSPPMEIRNWDGEVEGTTEYVVVSAAPAIFGGPETYIFPADADGNVTDWGELEGSFRGAFDHAAALDGAGYEVVP